MMAAVLGVEGAIESLPAEIRRQCMRVYTLTEFGALVGRSPQTICDWIARGKIDAHPIGPAQKPNMWLVFPRQLLCVAVLEPAWLLRNMNGRSV